MCYLPNRTTAETTHIQQGLAGPSLTWIRKEGRRNTRSQGTFVPTITFSILGSRRSRVTAAVSLSYPAKSPPIPATSPSNLECSIACAPSIIPLTASAVGCWVGHLRLLTIPASSLPRPRSVPTSPAHLSLFRHHGLRARSLRQLHSRFALFLSTC